MFRALTVEGSEKRGIRRPRRLQTLCGTLGVDAAELTPIIDAFRHPEVSFLMPPSDVPLRDTTVIDLSHESLMRVWTRLRAACSACRGEHFADLLRTTCGSAP